MTEARDAVAQRAPAPDLDLTHFPSRRMAAGRTLYRAHQHGQGPWWFGSTGGGRFDLPVPDGTCYLAEAALVAVRERLGTILGRAARVPEGLLAGVVVSALALPHAVRIANLRSAAAVDFAVLRELSTMVPYDIPQSWARALHLAGHRGVAYEPRFTPGRAGAIALFARSGDARWPADPTPTPAADVRGAPIAVAPPMRAQLTVLPTPRT